MRDSALAALAAALLWAVLALLVLPADKPAAEAPADPPSALLSVSSSAAPPRSEAADLEPTVPETAAASLPADAAFDLACQISVLTDQGVRSMDLESYLTGVLLAEMPVSFGPEALKAQAVACRTYTLVRCRSSRHRDAAVCTDSRCCQAWQDPAEAEPDARAQAEAAVKATDGLVLLYRGQLIDATFFSCSGGRTEDAAAVWGSDLPYLRAVASPGEEGAAHFSDEVRIPIAEFRSALEELDDGVRFSGEPTAWVESVQYTSGGGVEHLILGGRSFRGTVLRKTFSLRSTAFRLTLTEDSAIFTTRGNGHRVGMSQYGAAAMARAGNDFETILKWYYQGVELVRADGL